MYTRVAARRIPGLNLHLVAAFLVGVGDIHESMIMKHIDPFVPISHSTQAILATHRIQAVADALLVCGDDLPCAAACTRFIPKFWTHRTKFTASVTKALEQPHACRAGDVSAAPCLQVAAGELAAGRPQPHACGKPGL